MYRVLVRKPKATEAIVRPPFEFFGHHDKLMVHNGTNDTIHVTLPDGVFEDIKVTLTEAGAIPVAAGKKIEATVRRDAEVGVYSFQIFCDETQSYAQANSDPEFIVE